MRRQWRSIRPTSNNWCLPAPLEGLGLGLLELQPPRACRAAEGHVLRRGRRAVCSMIRACRNWPAALGAQEPLPTCEQGCPLALERQVLVTQFVELGDQVLIALQGKLLALCGSRLDLKPCFIDRCTRRIDPRSPESQGDGHSFSVYSLLKCGIYARCLGMRNQMAQDMTHNAMISSLIIFSWSAIAATLTMMTAPRGQDHTARGVSRSKLALAPAERRHSSGERACGGMGGSCLPP